MQINVTADAPLLFWSLLSLGASRKTPVAAQVLAGISAPLCTACGIEPFAVAALSAVELVGLPEGVLPLSQAAIYLALAPKANTALTAYGNARRLVKERGPLPVPLELRNAPTALMEGLGYGGGYRYPHNFEGSYVAEEYLPDALRGAEIVRLSGNGLERELAERLAALRARAKPGG